MRVQIKVCSLSVPSRRSRGLNPGRSEPPVDDLSYRTDKMAAGRDFLLCAAIVLMTQMVRHVQADCRTDLANVVAEQILTIQENSPAGTVILEITTDYTSLHFTPSAPGGFATVINGSIVTDVDVSLDGAQNSGNCAKSKLPQQLTMYCNSDTTNSRAWNLLVNYTDDYGPHFTAVETSVNESAPVGTTVIDLNTIVRDDDCTNAFNFYIDDKSKQYFKLMGSNLELTQSLDYETAQEHLINLTVLSSIQNGQDYLRNTTTLTVGVLDVDDMSPVFDISQFQLPLPEGQDISSNWYSTSPPIEARDGDVGINTTLVYSLHSVSPSLSLQINNLTGQVKILEQLDRENIPVYTVVVKAAQADVTYKSATGTLILVVEDANDNRPVFTSQPGVAIVEDAPDGSYVMELTGEDKDEGDNSLFNFVITSDTVGAFAIRFDQTTNRSQLIVGNSTALRGHSQAIVQFYLRELRPIVGPPCSNTTTCAGQVTIIIIDVNDHTPQFNSSSYTFALPSNTSGRYVIGQVFAEDGDRGNNALVKYSSTPVTGPPECSTISLDPSTGVLATDQHLPPGATCSWLLTACDSPTDTNTRRCSSVPLSVAVILSGDVVELNVTLPENVPVGTVVTSLPIAGLYTTSTDFEIKDNLLLTKVAIDRERQEFYRILVFSNQSMNAPVVNINVSVADVNDNSPSFANSSYIFTLASNDSSSSTVGQVQATDIDSEENADVVYSLTLFSGSVECSSFQLDPKTGELWTDKPLRAGVECPLLVTACDTPTDVSLRRCSSVPVTVTVILSWGVFEYNVTLQENVPVGTLVFILPMNGLDTTSTNFEVKDNSLLTTTDMDREQKDFYIVPIVPKQSTSSPIIIIIIRVNISDVNDNSPVFASQQYVFEVSSNVSSTSTIGNVSATDLDSGDNGEVHYNLTSTSGPEECSRLTLEPATGQLMTSQPLPAGITCSWIVIACDSSMVISSRRCSVVPLTVSVIPAGNIVESSVTIPENVPVGTMVKALPMKGLHTKSTEFEIRNDSVLYTKVPLDREQRDSYEVTIVSDQNVNVSVMIVHVNVSDVNDNVPVFGQSVYVINIDRSWEINETVLQVNASDADIGPNARLEFSMVTGKEYFAIDPTTGQIRLTNFPTTRDSEYQLLVTDFGSPALSSVSTLKVYSPVFNETASIVLPVSRDELMADREGVARKLGSILGMTVRIYDIERLGPAGSKVYISATSADGQPVSPTELNRLLDTHEMEIYNTFAKSYQPNADSDGGRTLSVLEIVLICLASVLLILVLLATFLWYRNHKKLRQSRRLFDSLNKDTAIYDNPRKPSSSAAVISNNNNNNSTNAQRMMARLSSGSVGNSSVTNLLTAQGDGNNSQGVTPPGSNGSQRRQQDHDYQNVVTLPLSNPVVNHEDIDATSPVEADREQITTFSSQITDEAVTTKIYPHMDESNQHEFVNSQAWPDDNTAFSGRRNSSIISDTETQMEDADEDDQEVADILSEPNPGISSLEDTVDSSTNRSNLDLMTTSSELEGSHPGGTDNPAYLDTDNLESSLPPEPEPDYAKRVRFTDVTATVDSSEITNSPDNDDKDSSLAKFLNQYGGAENLATNADTTQDSLEEMTAL